MSLGKVLEASPRGQGAEGARPEQAAPAAEHLAGLVIPGVQSTLEFMQCLPVCVVCTSTPNLCNVLLNLCKYSECMQCLRVCGDMTRRGLT